MSGSKYGHKTIARTFVWKKNDRMYVRIGNNLSEQVMKLVELDLGDVVQLQNQHKKKALRWNKSGVREWRGQLTISMFVDGKIDAVGWEVPLEYNSFLHRD